jgi:lysophospholipase L1-like esterase
MLPLIPGDKFDSPRLVFRLAVAFLSVCATLFAVEVCIRIVGPQDLGYWDSRSFRRILVSAPHFVENIPNGRASFLGVPVSINSDGLRGNDVHTPKPPHTVRLLAVGDSVTFGYGVRIEDTYASVLEKHFNEKAPDGIRYEVLNGGTLGGALGDYLHFLNQKAERLQPDIVIIGLCLNDILVYSGSGATSDVGAEWQGERKPILKLRELNYFLLRHSQLYMLVYAGLKSSLYSSGALNMNQVLGQDFVALAPPSDYQSRAWESSLQMLSRISIFCRDHKYRLVVVVFPMQMQMSPADLRLYREKYHLQLDDGALAGAPQLKLQRFAAATGMTLVDMLPVFRPYDSQELYLRDKMIPSDPVHPSVKGNQVIAAEIFRVLNTPE